MTEELTIETLPVDELLIEPSYQRTEISGKLIAEITKKFNPKKFGPIAVNIRSDGKKFVVDGQHRLESAKKMGFKTIVCEVSYGLNLNEEAEKFRGYNHRVTVSPLSQYRASCAALEYDAVELKNMMAKYGYRSGKNGETCVSCIAEIRKRWGKNPKLVESIFSFAAQTKSKITELLFRGLFHIGEKSNFLENPEFITRFQKKTWMVIDKSCSVDRSMTIGFSRRDADLAATIFKVINSGRGKHMKFEI